MQTLRCHVTFSLAFIFLFSLASLQVEAGPVLSCLLEDVQGMSDASLLRYERTLEIQVKTWGGRRFSYTGRGSFWRRE